MVKEMIKIRLSRKTWYYQPDRQLGPAGGFGEVYYGEDEDKNKFAIKKLTVDANETGHRELRIADDFAYKEFNNIIPIYDSGQDSESDNYFIVMALAEKSLQDELNKEICYKDLEAKDILLSIINGLLEVPKIIHRDLKPGNILFHDKKWKIADFGIAKFFEETTSLRTLKGWLSDPYAAPEQWQFEHSTKRTDIYAIGCIGYTLLTGLPPFNGPEREDYKKQHLYDCPHRLENHNILLCSLLLMMLRKNPDARPSIDRVKTILEKIVKNSNGKNNASTIAELRRIGQADAEKKSKKETEKQLKEAEKNRRLNLASEAWQILRNIIINLFNKIEENTPTAIRSDNSPFFRHLAKPSSVQLGQAELVVDYLINLGLGYENKFIQSGWDVLAGATILISQEKPENRWGASLWYMRQHPSNDYRWYEVPYMTNPMTRQRPNYAPFEIKNVKYADEAAAPGISSYQFAHQPEPIDDENEVQFIERWLKRFIQAYRGQLQRPSHLPY